MSQIKAERVQYRPWLNSAEAADYLRISKSTLKSKLREIPHSKLGGKLLFKASQLDKYLESKMVVTFDLKSEAHAIVARLKDKKFAAKVKRSMKPADYKRFYNALERILGES